MSSSEQPKEYIITEDELSVFETLAHEFGKTIREKQLRYIKEIRTRPHPAQSPDADCDTCLFHAQCRVIPYVPPCYNHGPDSPARTARKAREDVLKPFEEYANTLIEIECCVIRMKLLELVQSLRQHTGQVSER